MGGNEKKQLKIRKYFKEYCNATSIHGFKYFGEDRSIFERLWWFTVFALCLTACIAMIYKVYEKYDNSPIIVTFATKETPIYKIPFPAVTVCPQTKSSKKLFNFSKILDAKISKKSVSDNESDYFDYLSFICNDFDNKIHSENITFTANGFFDALEKISPDLSEFAHNCRFMGKNYNCSEIFTPVITDEGLCYSFNILDRSQIFSDIVLNYKNFYQTKSNNITWNIENGYVKTGYDLYPKRALFTGVTNGLTIHLSTMKEDIDPKCKSVQGYRVLLHTPGRIPRLSQEYFRVSLDQTVISSVTPVMIATSESVKSYSSSKRDCCFSSERNLKYFKNYSQLNCQLECLTNFTLKLCGCVNFYMPRDNNTEICGSGKFQCMVIAESAVQSEGKFQDDLVNENLILDSGDCDCMPLCSDLSYNIQTSQTNWNWEEKFENLKIKGEKKSMHLSSLTVYFKVNHFIAWERNELFGPTDFVANFGGLLGLFTGFSILSLMEIVYFLTVRVCCNIRLYGHWTGENL